MEYFIRIGIQRGRTYTTEQIYNLPQIHIPVRFSNRKPEIYLPRVLSPKSQPYETPIQITSPTNDPPKGLGKLTRSSSVHLKPLNITSLSVSPASRFLTTLIYRYRVDLLAISVHSSSPTPQRTVSVLPNNMPTSKSYPPTTHPISPRR